MKRNKSGFTLAELLIVVAIIAVLVAVAIPVFLGQLEKSRQAVDISNARSAYGAATVEVMTDPTLSNSVVFYSGTAITKERPTEGYGKSEKEFSSFCNQIPVPVTGTPKRNDSPAYLTIVFGQDQVESMSWGSFAQVMTASQWKNMSDEERLAVDIGLRDALTNALNNMSYQEIYYMLNNASPKKEKWGGKTTCYTLASSLIDRSTGEVWTDGNRNKIYTTDLFESIGYDLSNPEHQYLINSWGYDPSRTYNGKIDDLYIKVDIGADVEAMINSGQGDKKPTGVIVYLNGNGISTKDDPNFGHNRKS